MTNKEHLLVPPADLVELWVDLLASRSDEDVFSMAAQWGADQELEACCEHLKRSWAPSATIDNLRAARRPKPPSLKEQALAELDSVATAFRIGYGGELACDTIRRALEQLDD